MSGAQGRRWQALWAVALLLCLAVPSLSFAHDVPQELRMQAFVRAEGERLRVLVRVPLDLVLNLGLPKRGNGYLDLRQMDRALPRAVAALAKDLQFIEDGKRLEHSNSGGRISEPSDKSFQSYEQALELLRGPPLPHTTDVFWNQGYFDAWLEYPIESTQGTFEVNFQVSPGLRERLKLDLRYVLPDGGFRPFELTTGSGPIALDPKSYQAARTFMLSGIEHIAGGWDHLLFLLCLVLPFRRLGWSLIAVVTAFTLAHSVTLVAAALGWVPTGEWFPPLVETLIALSILYMAIENIVWPRLHDRWLLTALFGLVHGFGFSFSLAHELQFAGSHLLVALLSFNVGIEIGQLLVLAALWMPLSWVLRHAPAGDMVVVAVISAAAAHVAWHWTMERWTALAGSPDVDLSLLWGTALAAAAAIAGLLVLRALAQRAAESRWNLPWMRR